MKVEVKNLVLKYPIKNLDNYLFRARMLRKIKNLIFKNKNTNTNNIEEKPLDDGIVALKNINDDEIDDFINWCIKKGFDLTFIETMPMGDIGNENRLNHFLSLNELKKICQKVK